MMTVVARVCPIEDPHGCGRTATRYPTLDPQRQ